MFRSNSSQHNFPVAKALIGLCLAIYVVQYLAGSSGNAAILGAFGLSRAGLSAGYFWQPFTHIFLHSTVWHLAFNLLALWFAGRAVEEWCGSLRLLLVFVLGGIGGGLLQVLLAPASLLIGASGGVCAVLLAFCTLQPKLPITALLFFVIPIRMRAQTLGALIIAVSIVLPLLGLFGNIGHFAHLGGAITGLLVALVWRKSGKIRLQISRDLTPPPLPPMQFSPGLSGSTLEKNTAKGEMDRILNKVLQNGIQSLSQSERGTLERWNSSSPSR